MLSFRSNFTVVAGTTTANVVAGDLLQFLPFNAKLNFWQTQSAAGLLTTITVGTMVVGGSGAGMRPNINAAGDIDTLADGIAEALGAKNDQLIISVNNPTGGNLTSTVAVVAKPI